MARTSSNIEIKHHYCTGAYNTLYNKEYNL